MWPVAVAVVGLAAIGVIGFLYFTMLELRDKSHEPAQANSAAAPVTPATAQAATAPPASAPLLPVGERFSAETVPFVTDRARAVLTNEYVAAAEPKAFALNLNGVIGLASSRPNDEVAKSAALEQCQERADAIRLHVNARSMPSAAPWFTLMAGRLCRLCRGSSATL